MVLTECFLWSSPVWYFFAEKNMAEEIEVHFLSNKNHLTFKVNGVNASQENIKNRRS
jgi:hypothetical protein